jgi:hypothetical protein
MMMTNTMMTMKSNSKNLKAQMRKTKMISTLMTTFMQMIMIMKMITIMKMKNQTAHDNADDNRATHEANNKREEDKEHDELENNVVKENKDKDMVAEDNDKEKSENKERKDDVEKEERYKNCPKVCGVYMKHETTNSTKWILVDTNLRRELKEKSTKHLVQDTLIESKFSIQNWVYRVYDRGRTNVDWCTFHGVQSVLFQYKISWNWNLC